MKAQFKYAFLAGLHFRGAVFAVIFIVNSLLIIFSLFGVLPIAVHVIAVFLGGLATTAMAAGNIGGDVAIARRMFSAPEAYLHALTPVPRWKILLASISTMAVMDLFTMIFTVITQILLVLNLVFSMTGDDTGKLFWEAFFSDHPYWLYGLWGILMLITSYFLFVIIILFSVTAVKSFLFKMPASRFLGFLLALGCLFIANMLMQLVLLPFDDVQRFGLLIISAPGSNLAYIFVILLTLAEAAGLFIITSKLMERKINI